MAALTVLNGDALVPVRLMVLDGSTPITNTTANDIKLSALMAGSAVAAAAGSVGTITRAPAQADSVAADVATLRADFNSLLAKLRTAGVLATA